MLSLCSCAHSCAEMRGRVKRGHRSRHRQCQTMCTELHGPAKPDRQLEEHVRKGILQLPPCVKTYGQQSHRLDLAHDHSSPPSYGTGAKEETGGTSRDVNIPAISVKRDHGCLCGIHRASKLSNHLRTVRSNAGRFTTLREEAQVTAYNPHAADQEALTSRSEARPRHAHNGFKLVLSKSEGILPLNRWESPVLHQFSAGELQQKRYQGPRQQERQCIAHWFYTGTAHMRISEGGTGCQ